MAAFNEKTPTRRIQAMQLAQSVNQRPQRIQEAQDGVYVLAARAPGGLDGGGAVCFTGLIHNPRNLSGSGIP